MRIERLDDHPLTSAILASTQQSRVGALEKFCAAATYPQLLGALYELHAFSQRVDANMYQRVRALFQAHAICRFFLPCRPELPRSGTIPFEGQELLHARRFNEAIEYFQSLAMRERMTDALASALTAAYQGHGFQLLAGLVQHSVRALPGNRWMFRTTHPFDHPLRIRRELLETNGDGRFPLLVEKTPVRMDLTHSGWSDIFFLGMDYPEGARVLNISVDLAVYGHHQHTAPPITCYLRVIDEPVLRLTSVDLGVSSDSSEVSDVHDFARDYLGLLKAAVIASGIIPPGLEGSGQPIASVFERMIGPGLGLEIVSQVNDIPKGSRLAVSTNLLGGLIALCMRATGQVASLSGDLTESERRIVAGRAVLGEWLGGSGGGWQDSGGIWPGIKVIEGVLAESADVEYGSSRGRLLPRHTLLGHDSVSREVRERLQESLVVVHGGLAANVGPILEMVTEKYLLGTTQEWQARLELIGCFDQILSCLKTGDIREFGRITTLAFQGPLQTIVPWVSNYYTERLIDGAREEFGDYFWGFWMMGGMSGGGMGFIFDPAVRSEAEAAMLSLMRREKASLEHSLPFAMDPVVYRVAINEKGTHAALRQGPEAVLSAEYYLLMLPRWLHNGSRTFSPSRRRELEAFSCHYLSGPQAEPVGKAIISRLFPPSPSQRANQQSVDELLDQNGFDREQHERIRSDLLAGRIGLMKNRLPADTLIEEIFPGDVTSQQDLPQEVRALGCAAIERGEVAVVTLAAGAGSRWTQGAGTVKALHPFAKFRGRFRTFVEVHLAKSRQTGRTFGLAPTHIFTTSYLTHAPIQALLQRERDYGLTGQVVLSPGRSIGLRFVPTARDLEFAWQEQREQKLEERKQKLRESSRKALIDWAITTGEASDYRDNVPLQCLHPVGHWYEVANLLLNGTLKQLLEGNPNLKYLLLHNIDTLGASVDPAWLGGHIQSGAALSFEVVQRRLEDRGGGLARVAGRLRLVEGLALPREEDEARLSCYNSLTTWISIEKLLALFGLTRGTLSDPHAVRHGVRSLAARLPTYITLKEVKRRWGNAQEDVLTIAQFERLWGDMTALPEAKTNFFVVPRARGQQLKDVAQLDGWVRDGSRNFVESLCDFT